MFRYMKGLCKGNSQWKCAKRALTSTYVYNTYAEPRKMGTQVEIDEFESLLPHIVKEVTELFPDLPEMHPQFDAIFRNNVPGHKASSSFAVVAFYKLFEEHHKLTPKNIKAANILGWCVDMEFAAFQMTDDIIDESVTRLHKPCWYKNRDVALRALNDANIIEKAVYFLLRKYVSDHPNYLPILEWIRRVNEKTTLGQIFDGYCYVDGKPAFHLYTPRWRKVLVKYKSTIPEILFPLRLALHFSGKYSRAVYEQIKPISMTLGEYFVNQNDMLDCYGDPAVTGKIGSDIRCAKCTWLLMEALQRATREQTRTMYEHYGRRSPESEMIIKELYNRLGLLDVFLEYEEETFELACRQIEKLDEFLQEPLTKFTKSLFGKK